MKNVLIIGGLGVLVMTGGVLWSKSLEGQQVQDQIAKTDPAEIVTKNGLHSHPKIQIVVNDEQVPIPGNIGVGPQYAGTPTYDAGMKMTAMHTHETDGTIHLEFPGLVTKDDLKLKNFFLIWGKELTSFGILKTVTVNGDEIIEIENYVMEDGDSIVLKYANE